MTLDILIPYWGDPDLMIATTASVVAQDDPRWRLTILDDQYPGDEVRTWVESLGDERITYHVNERNLGITDNYRAAVGRATQSHLTLLGCDDLLHPGYVGLMRSLVERHPDADVFQPGVQVIDADGTPVLPLVDRVKQRLLTPRREVELRGPDMATSLIRGNWLYWPSLTFRTETLQRIDFRDGLPIIQDLALLMDIAFEGGALVYSPVTAFSYRRHSGSASQKTIVSGQRFRDERTYYRTARELARRLGWRRTARAARWRLLSRLHGLAELPGVLRSRSRAGISSTVAHILAP
ncbi:glycosyltransferase, group 2 family protein [Aeromicrobium marinum DSM 15272]|uniref:Glycosyltransferase, group 2 family protein n=1 Tax=Aeromicrobium marinum DSM 15272 TaxID=585531 RepID=E2SG26_9ACTN|nr:glycosyltransferase [Aeromicrobium marinum]EFQ81783.1 glycosyltransferase, group 2 family protein [Aeromicrobium marinum DSM 15272]